MNTLLQTERGEIRILPSQPRDWTAYRTMRLEALRNHPTAFGSSYEDNLLHEDGHWQQRVTTQDEREALYFAWHEGRLIGMTGIYRDLGRKQLHAAEVWGVYVKPEWRGLHIAEALIEACLDWARKKKVVIARLGVAVDNLPALRCYERCGFTTTGVVQRAIFHDGQFVDEYLMSCLLDGSR
jgi:RimJ/RimL family protein N-acetyltransferase